MSYLILIIVAVTGIGFGYYFALRHSSGQARQGNDVLIAELSKRKAENKKKIKEFLQENEKIQNNDVEKLVGVSHATAERYLDELEKEGRITQHGKIGQSVFYTLK